MSDPLDYALLALLAPTLLLVLWLALRPREQGPRAEIEKLERELRDAMSRQEQAGRADLAQLQRTLLAQGSDNVRLQNEQIDAFRGQLVLTQQAMDAALRRVADTLAEQLRLLSEANERRVNDMRQGVETRLADVRQAVDARLAALQDGNEKKLDQMRATVDEKLNATLEQRLGESFRLVADRLEQVHKGLGEMQGLARDVGALNRVLTNVKTRGVFGEVRLQALLEQVFTPEQYAANVATVPGSNERVEFALRLPGRHDSSGGLLGEGAPLWLPIDAKFPRDDYERLVDASERGDVAAMDAAGKAIEARLKLEARTIREKYLAPPHTTDFAILFLPTEGLYAEALRRPGLADALQREWKVMLAGPTTLLALLNSLQMGFRTLALERRSAEVWEVLGAVKTEFAKFGDVLAKTRKKLDEASNTINLAERRTRVMARELRGVEAVSDARVQQLLPGLAPLADAAVERLPDDEEADA